MKWDSYRKALDGLSYNPDFEQQTIKRLQQHASTLAQEQDGTRCADRPRNRKTAMNTIKKRTWFKSAAAVVATFALAGSAYAAVTLLSAGDVAHELKQDKVAAAFNANNAVSTNETQHVGPYDVTLQGVTSGADLATWDTEVEPSPKQDANNWTDQIKSDQTYAVLAIQRTDGKAITQEEAYGEFANPGDAEAKKRIEEGEDTGILAYYSVSPLISGYTPWQVNGWTLGAGHTTCIKDGVLYFLFEAENLQPFADHTIYLTFYERNKVGHIIPGADTFALNDDGMISFAKEYTKEGALFILPLDSTQADPETAANIVKDLVEDDTAKDDSDADYTIDVTESGSQTIATVKEK